MARSEAPGSRSGKTTLVTRFSALGDVAMTLPLLYNVALSNPERRFLLLTRPLPARIFINAPENLEVLPVDLKNHGSLGDMARLTMRLCRQYDIDSYADLHDVLRTKWMRLLMRLRGVRTRHIDKLRRRKRALTRRNGKDLVPLTPVHRLYADVFTHLGITRRRSFISLFGPEGADPSLTAPIFGDTVPDFDEGLHIAIAPFARHRGKIYPEHHIRKVIDTLAARPGVTLYLMGGREETELLEKWRAGRGNIVNVAAAGAGFEAELALLSRCHLLLSMDSANMHLASLVGCPVVSIWGATHPYTGFYGRGQKPENAVQTALPCRPCSIYGNRPCLRGDYMCLEALPPETVITRIDKVCGNREEN